LIQFNFTQLSHLNIIERNLSSHIYDEDELQDILYKLSDYKNAFCKLKEYLEKESQKNQ